MAAGKPVVATRVEGVQEAMGELANDQCVAPGDGNRLADLIIQIAQNPQLAADLGGANQERAAREFSLDAMVAKYERLFALILAS
jgi:glycosyltransferase involved in cell wall biosynthesis